ncbi:hypothetical protein TNCV_2633161 [Trichonephila clavipes]|nr:hypothetical protein TNCV_2633161 [Trichonephila clavipes]
MSCQLDSSDGSLNSIIGFISESASWSFLTLSSFHASDSYVDGAITWWITRPIMPNFFSILEQYLLFSRQGLLEGASTFPSVDPSRWMYTCSHASDLPFFLSREVISEVPYSTTSPALDAAVFLICSWAVTFKVIYSSTSPTRETAIPLILTLNH